jgi:hypothetical protein
MSSAACTGTVDCVYEAHFAVAVTGIDHQVWTAYCFVDTYFGAEDSVDNYDEIDGFGRRPDPLAAGHLHANQPIGEPRAYFFKIFERRMHLVVRNWNAVIDNTKKDIEQYVCALSQQYFRAFVLHSVACSVSIQREIT